MAAVALEVAPSGVEEEAGEGVATLAVIALGESTAAWMAQGQMEAAEVARVEAGAAEGRTGGVGSRKSQPLHNISQYACRV